MYKFQLDKNIRKQTVDLYIVHKGSRKQDDYTYFVLEEKGQENQAPYHTIEPALSLPYDEMNNFTQKFMDVLWESGMRPTDYKIQLEAQEKHLEDMRKLVFEYLLKVKK